MQHYWAAALFGSCWLLVLAAALTQVVLAACISSSTHTSMQHCSAAALFKSWWLLVVADALVHQSSIIELRPYKLCWLLAVADSLVHQSSIIELRPYKLCWLYTYLFQLAGCSY